MFIVIPGVISLVSNLYKLIVVVIMQYKVCSKAFIVFTISVVVFRNTHPMMSFTCYFHTHSLRFIYNALPVIRLRKL